MQADGIVYIEANLSGARPANIAERAAHATMVVERLRAVAGVRDVALIAGQTLFGAVPDGVEIGLFRPPDGVRILAHTHAATPGYFRILRPDVVTGRLPTENEVAAGAPVVVVSETVAQSYWPGANPLGQQLRAWSDERMYQVIGVVRDIPWLSWDAATPMTYGPFAPLPGRISTVTLFVETGGSPAARVTRDVLRELETMTPAVTARRAGRLVDIFADTIAVRRFRSWLFGGFAAAALAVVGVGVLGLLAMSTARRTREVGIRQALGATRGSIVRLLVREQMRPALVGLTVGIAISAWAVQFVESYLFGVTATDPRVWGAAILLILMTAGAGALIPSIRASATDPTMALRAE